MTLNDSTLLVSALMMRGWSNRQTGCLQFVITSWHECAPRVVKCCSKRHALRCFWGRVAGRFSRRGRHLREPPLSFKAYPNCNCVLGEFGRSLSESRNAFAAVAGCFSRCRIVPRLWSAAASSGASSVNSRSAASAASGGPCSNRIRPRTRNGSTSSRLAALAACNSRTAVATSPRAAACLPRRMRASLTSRLGLLVVPESTARAEATPWPPFLSGE